MSSFTIVIWLYAATATIIALALALFEVTSRRNEKTKADSLLKWSEVEVSPSLYQQRELDEFPLARYAELPADEAKKLTEFLKKLQPYGPKKPA